MLYVVTGPPAAGKSSWIKSHAKADDVVIDLDLMALAMSGPGADHHDHSDTLLAIVHAARRAAIAEAERHLATTDVYLIHTMPSPKTRAKYRRLNARIITVDPGEAEVRRRVKAMRQPGMEAVVTRWYSDYRKGGSRALTRQTYRQW